MRSLFVSGLLLLAFSSSLFAQKTSRTGPPRGAHPVLLTVGDESVLPRVERDETIVFALYTLHEQTLKLSAHLMPLDEDEPHTLKLHTRVGDGDWTEAATAEVNPIGWTGLFRVEDWDDTLDYDYKITNHAGQEFEGRIRKNPVDQEVIRAGLFTGNSPSPGGGMIPRDDIVENIRKLDPDVLFFTGDQVYNHFRHTEHWLNRFGKPFVDILRDRPVVCLPDDHDIGQPNMWGGGGAAVDVDTKGGYTRPADYVKMVERQQTSHMPDPVDPEPILQGIGVYFTNLNVGGVDFALLEDRKFKSGCWDFDVVGKGYGPRPDHLMKRGIDLEQFDLEGLDLLGERQEAFLEEWGQEWDGVTMKSVVSQTIFGMTSTHGGGGRDRYIGDFDANGWPQTPRDRAVDLMRRCFAVHLCGDQHLSLKAQYGLDAHRDASWVFMAPSIANLYPRWWAPDDQEAANAEPGAPEFTGDFKDGFGNLITIYAHTNPRETGREPAVLHDRMPGFGIVDFNKTTREITMHNWPRQVDVDAEGAFQHEGWPRTISQFDNYAREATGYLPPIEVEGATDPVVQVVKEDTGEVIYTLRILGNKYQPAVFEDGTYTIRVTLGEVTRELPGLEPSESKGGDPLLIGDDFAGFFEPLPQF